MSAIAILEKLGADPDADVRDLTNEEHAALMQKIQAFKEINAALIITEPDDSEPDEEDKPSEPSDNDDDKA
ncbi:hypothetical protein DRW07_05105 [Alteromonas sediminis]|uniref:Uncharacterized protein n=1 Tax=Alteromonas sediminis TaxID=2259342 RepID=A0A3N5ZBM3_9ALTE|nr:hypothetical protein [Alteromonas sediminis]RPJ68774.1 hypothetical protein DRW07_05105 [Alteromonas sediminis]